MKKALLLFPDNRPFPTDLGPLLTDAGLFPSNIGLSEVIEQVQAVNVAVLLLDATLFSSLDAQTKSRLAAICARKKIPALIAGTDRPLDLSQLNTDLPWTAGVIRNIDDREEWAEKLTLYRHLGSLEQKVSDLQNKIEARWREDEEDLRSAAQIQQSLLPTKLPSLPHFNVSCHFHPFEKIGGDLFTLRQVDEDTLMLFLLDVSGHGISSAMVSISVHQSLSLHTGQIVKRIIDKPPYYRLLPPVEVMTELAAEYPFERFEMFFTIVYMLIDIHTGQARYCSAGHPPPLLQRRNGKQERLSIGGGLIGLPDTGPFEQGEVTLERGDRLFLFSDGLIDHTDASGDCFGEERLVQSLSRNGDTLQDSCQNALDAMHNFRGALPSQDDVSLLGLEFTKMSGQASP